MAVAGARRSEARSRAERGSPRRPGGIRAGQGRAALDGPGVFFTEPHYDGYAAILVRLGVIDDPMLAKLITDSWRLKAPKRFRDWQPGRP